MAVDKVPFTVRINVEDHAKLKHIAKAESRSMANMIEYLVRKEITKYEKENGVIEITELDISEE